MAWLLEGQGIEDEEFVVHKLAFTPLLTVLASLTIASSLAVDDIWRAKILMRGVEHRRRDRRRREDDIGVTTPIDAEEHI